eukprot:9102798-Ditylum_brightwellii.AAC.1
MKHAKSSILADKREGASKRDGASFVKLSAMWCKKECQIKTWNFGLHTADNTSEDAAAGIDHALISYDDEDDEELSLIHI